MISFFRGIFSSKIGLAITFVFVGLIAFAFATADVSGSGAFGNGTDTGTAVQVGESELSASELNQSVNNAFRGEQRQNPGLDLTTFVEGGGFDSVLDRLINSFAISDFGKKYGITAGKRLVDAEIADIPSFQGADGQFSEENFRRALQSQGINEKQLRDDFSRNLIAEQLLPVAGYGVSVPEQLVSPYASLLLEGRQGSIGTIPSVAFIDQVKPAPTAVAAFYSKNSARYTIPERRAIRYSLFDKSRFTDKIKPSDKEIEGYYTLNKARYAASENRNLEQVILPTEAAAKALGDKISGGMSISAAAQSVGLSASAIGSVSKTAFATATSQAVANAAFAAKSGAATAPAQSALGWHIVNVNSIEQIKGKSLADARAEITGLLTASGIDEALAEFTVSLEDEFSSGSSFADVAKDQELKIESTPMLLANGQDPQNQNYQPIPELQRILPTGFGLEEDSEPQLIEIVAGEQYAIVEVGKITEAAPPLLKAIEQLVTRDYMLDQGSKKAKTVADAITKKINGGMSAAQAIAEAGVKLPPVSKIKSTRTEIAQLSQKGQQIPPPVALMFSMAEKTAKALKAPGDQGWFVVSLDNIDAGDASKRPDLLNATKSQFKQVFGNEYTAQLINAMKADIGVEKNDDAISALKDRLSGRSSTN